MGGDGDEHPEWRRRRRTAEQCVIPWMARHIPLAGRTVLEYGCGQGAVACALAPSVAHHIGIDIEPGEVDLARGHARRLDRGNVEFVVAPAATIRDQVAERAGEIDVFLLYAVLEHLTLDERLAVLALARDVVRPDGHIVIVESPNRLTPIDHHTARMPYLHMLPLELAERYYRRSERRDFVDAVDVAGQAGTEARREALARWGRGVSFHEAELVFGDLAAHTVASSYAPELYPVRPVRWEELQAAAVLEAWRPDLPPCWSRTWLDTILSARPQSAVREHVRPWPLRLAHDVPNVAVLPDGRLELRPGAVVPVDLPAPTRELHVGLMSEQPDDALRVTAAGVEHAPAAIANWDEVPPWHASVTFPRVVDRVELSLPLGGNLTYVGFRGPADPDAPNRRPQCW